MAAHVSLQYVAPAMRRSEQHFVSVRLHGGQEQASSTVARREQQGIGRVELHELLSVMESGRAFRRVRRLGCFKIGEGGELGVARFSVDRNLRAVWHAGTPVLTMCAIGVANGRCGAI